MLVAKANAFGSLHLGIGVRSRVQLQEGRVMVQCQVTAGLALGKALASRDSEMQLLPAAPQVQVIDVRRRA